SARNNGATGPLKGAQQETHRGSSGTRRNRARSRCRPGFPCVRNSRHSASALSRGATSRRLISACKPPETPLEEQTLERSNDRLLVVARAEVVQRMRRQGVLGAYATAARVEDRVDVARGILLERRGDAVGRTRVDEALEREDPVVDDPALGILDEHAREIRLLVPKLRRVRDLVQ